MFCQVSNLNTAMELGINLGSLLCEAGWFPAASTVYRALVNVARWQEKTEPSFNTVLMESLAYLLHSLSSNYQFEEASTVYHELRQYVSVKNFTATACTSSNPNLLSHVYKEFSHYHLTKSDYSEAYDWGLEAVKMMTPSIPVKLTVDVFRQASKSCVVMQEFKKAKVLIKNANRLSRDTYGKSHCKFADCQEDFGFYLVNTDCNTESVESYKNAVEVRRRIFGHDNLQVAAALEGLAFSMYVAKYSTRDFKEARKVAKESLFIRNRLLPHNHFTFASSKRVLALIIEAIAINTNNEETLSKAESYLLDGLQIALFHMGEINVKTSNFYGNLGRLYKYIEKFEEAEEMFLKAINIKECLLGNESQEVALSVSDLATLYNYNMDNLVEAEKLYLRSIKIFTDIFGPGYTGLQYDYTGLSDVYRQTGNQEKLAEYQNKLDEWRLLLQHTKNHAQG